MNFILTESKLFSGRRSRAQLFSADFLFASSVAIALLIVAFFAFERMGVLAGENNRYAELSAAASDAIDGLVQSPGRPSNWTRTGKIDSARVQSLGLALENGVLDPDKVSFFFNALNRAQSNSNYSNASLMLGLRRPGYDFSLSIADLQGNALYSTNASAQPDFNVSSAFERPAVLNDSLVRVKISVWSS